jgi:hypothetical protein
VNGASVLHRRSNGGLDLYSLLGELTDVGRQVCHALRLVREATDG